MPSLRSNAIRIKRFRELKQDLRTQRDRLLVGIDIAKAQHVAQVRLAHTQLVDKRLTVPNTAAGFAAFWAHLQRRQRETGVPEIVCAVEPTGTYHEALAQFLEAHGADVVLVSTTVAHHNRRTLDGTWGKSDPKDAHNLGDLLERGHVLFYSLPDAQTATLRRLVRLLRHARVELGACEARFRNTLLPALGPAGEPLPLALVAALPDLLDNRGLVDKELSEWSAEPVVLDGRVVRCEGSPGKNPVGIGIAFFPRERFASAEPEA
jgi:transposase